MFFKILKILTFISGIFYVESKAFMSTPVCRRSKYSDYYLSNNLVDYNISSPLETFGYTYPCKGFPEGPVVTEYKTNKIEIILEPKNPFYGGGHCQFGISYDNKNFIVLKQVIHNCLLTNYKHKFELPDVPNGKLTIFWTWINAVGNRGYYMDCADVNINIRNNNITSSIIEGKELIIANLEGYPVIPEFFDDNKCDGKELLLNAKNKTITINKDFTTTPETTTTTTTTTTPQEPTTTITTTTPQEPTTTKKTTTTPEPTTTITNVSTTNSTTKQIPTTIIYPTEIISISNKLIFNNYLSFIVFILLIKLVVDM